METPRVTSEPKGRRITWEDDIKAKSRSQRKSSDNMGSLHIPRVYHSPAGPVTPTFHEVRNRFAKHSPGEIPEYHSSNDENQPSPNSNSGSPSLQQYRPGKIPEFDKRSPKGK